MTSFDDALGTVMRLSTAAEALAALAARLRADIEGIALDPAVAASLDSIVAQLGIELPGLTPEQRRGLAISARSPRRSRACASCVPAGRSRAPRSPAA